MYYNQKKFSNIKNYLFKTCFYYLSLSACMLNVAYNSFLQIKTWLGRKRFQLFVS